MSVISVDEKRDGKDGSQSVGNTKDRRTFIVRTNNQQDGRVTVLAASALPAMQDVYQTDTDIDLTSRVIRRVPNQRSRFVWEVVIHYSSEVETETETAEFQDFLGQPVKVAVSFIKAQEVVGGTLLPVSFVSRGIDVAPEGNGGVNSAGEPFDPPITKDVSRIVLTFQKNEDTFDIPRAQQYQDSINDDHWFGFPEKHLKVESISTPGKQRRVDPDNNPVDFYPITYIIHGNKVAWKKFILNQGTFFIKDGQRHAFLTAEGFPRIGLLTSTGGELGEGEDNTFSDIDVYEPQTFGNLGLPPAMP